MNLLHEHLARAQRQDDLAAAQRARQVKALRARRRAERLASKAHNASQRAAARLALLGA